MRRTRQVLLAVASSLALTSGLLIAVPPAAISAPATPAETTSPDSLRWSDCRNDALSDAVRCSWLKVPRDWANPDTSGTYRIRVARIRASGPSIGVLTFNPGGPGGAGVEIIELIHGSLPAHIRRSFDLVGWDPRGVGQSGPSLKSCQITSPQVAPTGAVDVDAYAEAVFTAVSDANSVCLRRNQAHVNNLGTWQVIRDLDALRASLRVAKISFWGMSYGTTVGRAYAQTFPHRLSALVLDGAIDPSPTIHSYMREHIWDDYTAVQRMLGAFGPRYVKTYLRAMRYLDKRVLRFAGGRKLTRWEFGSFLTGQAAYQSSWREVRKFLDQVRRALNSPNQRTAQTGERIHQWITEPPLDPLSQRGRPRTTTEYEPLTAFVNCSDMHDRPSPQALAAAGQEAIGVGGVPYLLPVLFEGAACSGLPPLGRPLPGLRTTLRLTPRPIVINAIADNRTPYQGARALANALSRAPMIVYDGTQHVSYGRVSHCIDAPVTRYLLTLELPSESVACPLQMPQDWRR